jgi:nucleoside-triphosphatase THEP1
MAGIDIRSPQRVGKYGVDVAAIDAVAETTLAPEAAAVFLVDEIGKARAAKIRAAMPASTTLLQFLLVLVAGWLHRRQARVIK